MKKIIVVGNCQTAPLVNQLKTLKKSLEFLPNIIVHLTNDDNFTDDMKIISSADIILTQNIQAGYPVKHVVTSFLRENFPSKKIIVWPNLFFNGDNPELTYITSHDGKRLSGPLTQYHNKYIFKGWIEGYTGEDLVLELPNLIKRDAENIHASVQRSLEELVKRSSEADVNVCDKIQSLFGTVKLFHTFNHPCSLLLNELSRQVSALIFENEPALDLAELPNEPLGAIQPGLHGAISEILGFSYPRNSSSTGVCYTYEESNFLVEGRKEYSLGELIMSFYNSYAHALGSPSQCDIQQFRFTPNYVV